MQKYGIIPESPSGAADKFPGSASACLFIAFLIADYMILPIFAATNKIKAPKIWKTRILHLSVMTVSSVTA